MQKLLIVSALALVACDRGHYATRDHGSETSGEEASTNEGEISTETAASTETSTEATTSTETGSSTDTESESEAQAQQAAEVEAEALDRRERARDEELARARRAEASNVTITVHTTSGPISAGIARHALAAQHLRVEQCYRSVLGPDAVGSIRASLHVEASGATRCELETMVPEIDRALPCIDAALERTPFPATSDGRPTHIVLEVSRSAPR
ncbi:MAG: hypothetical protein J0L92_05825 [Deltaproteobacteria bacterium]|nr:hypothetical protein [Deltaproteobacteria bacterium]